MQFILNIFLLPTGTAPALSYLSIDDNVIKTCFHTCFLKTIKLDTVYYYCSNVYPDTTVAFETNNANNVLTHI